MKIHLVGDTQREYALKCVKEAPKGHVVTITPKKRSLDQNAKFHALCQDIGSELGYTAQEMKELAKYSVFGIIEREFHGKTLAELKATSKCNTQEMGQLIDWLYITAAENGIQLNYGE